MFNNVFLKNRVLYEIMWKKYGRDGQVTDDNTLRCMRFACCVAEVTDTDSEYVIRIAFPRQSGSRTLPSVTLYVHCFSSYYRN
jgi:hypothetical protein